VPVYPPQDADQPVTILRTNDPAVLAVAKSLLDEAGIEFFVAGETVGALYPGPGVGPYIPELRVAARDAEAARELLKELA
jgi:hypothetical protein